MKRARPPEPEKGLQEPRVGTLPSPGRGGGFKGQWQNCEGAATGGHRCLCEVRGSWGGGWLGWRLRMAHVSSRTPRTKAPTTAGGAFVGCL